MGHHLAVDVDGKMVRGAVLRSKLGQLADQLDGDQLGGRPLDQAMKSSANGMVQRCEVMAVHIDEH